MLGELLDDRRGAPVPGADDADAAFWQTRHAVGLTEDAHAGTKRRLGDDGYRQTGKDRGEIAVELPLV